MLFSSKKALRRVHTGAIRAQLSHDLASETFDLKMTQSYQAKRCWPGIFHCRTDRRILKLDSLGTVENHNILLQRHKMVRIKCQD